MLDVVAAHELTSAEAMVYTAALAGKLAALEKAGRGATVKSLCDLLRDFANAQESPPQCGRGRPLQ